MDILIVESSALVITRMEALLSELENIKTIQLASSFEEALKLFNAIKPQVVLLDIGLPPGKSVELLKNIKASKMETVVIALAIHTDALTKQKFRSAGADFFFDKFHDIKKLASTINTIAAAKN